MKSFVVIPDSFKGTMSSQEVCQIMEQAILKVLPQAKVNQLPVADGGEGSVEAFLKALGGEKKSVKVHGPYMEELDSFYGLLPDGTAVIEMAAAAGLPLVGDKKQAEKTTTYGVGELMLAAAQAGCKSIIMGLGGSCTNDGGCGAAAACGIRFFDATGEEFVPVGESLGNITRIDTSGLVPQLRGMPIITMCDIDNPLCGVKGAAAVFGPQKGADAATVNLLEAGLKHMAEVVQRDLLKEILTLPGAGAAGGMGGGMVAFFNSPLQMGIETVLDTVNFDEIIKTADCIFTGEGRVDEQSLMGKVICGVTRRAQRAGVPVICVAGGIETIPTEAYQRGLTAAFSINQKPLALEEALPLSRHNLSFTMENIVRTLALLAR